MHRGGIVPKALRAVLRRTFFRVRIRGLRNLRTEGAVICVSNHEGSFGPVSLLSALLPRTLRPWVAHEVTDMRTCAARVQADFTEGELHLKPPWSRIAARLIARACVAVMAAVDAIPVYRDTRRVAATVRETLRRMKRGETILIFPEDPQGRRDGALREFYCGFLHLARSYHMETRGGVSFLPIAVHRESRTALIGRPIPFDAEAPFPQEKNRLKTELAEAIRRMYGELARDAAGSRAA